MLYPIKRSKMGLELARRFVNSSRVCYGTEMRLNPLEISLMVQILTQFGLRMVNKNNGLMNN